MRCQHENADREMQIRDFGDMVEETVRCPDCHHFNRFLRPSTREEQRAYDLRYQREKPA